MPNHDLTAVRKIGRGNQAKAVNLKTDNTKAKRKVQKKIMIYKTLHRKLNEQQDPHKKTKHG
jgi:hypothetical protein